MITNIETYAKGGKVFTQDDFVDGENIRVIRYFLDNLFLDFVKKSYNFFETTGDLPFIYREKQLHSILCPSLYHISDALFMEQPIKRIKKKEKSFSEETQIHGWTDYFCEYNNIVFIIEVKHNWQSLSEEIRNSTQECWDSAEGQLKILRNQLQDIYPDTKTFIAINLLVLPTYNGNKKEEGCIQLNSEKSIELFNKIIKQLKPMPNWGGLWILNRELKKPFEYEEGYESYSSLMFLVHMRQIK